MTQPHLPTELVQAILAELGAALRRGVAHDWGSEALAACCLTSRKMLPLARAELYHTVSLTIGLKKKTTTPRVSPERLSTTIQSNLQIAAAVRQLNLWDSHGAPAHFVRSVVETSVRACKWMEGFDWEVPLSLSREKSAGWLEGALKTRGKTLRYLKVTGGYFQTAHLFVDMLHHLPHLQSLELDNPPHLDDESLGLPRPSFSLQYLSLPAHEVAAHPALLDLLLGASQDSLTDLCFGGISTGTIYDFSAFTSLHDVTITTYLPTDQGDPFHLFETLGTIPSLRSLNFDLDYYTSASRDGIREETDSFRLLPSSLRAITAPFGISLASHHLLDYLGNPTCLPRLKYIDVNTCVGDEFAVTVDRTEEEVAALETAASARGMELWWC